jgi:hypothetical protein
LEKQRKLAENLREKIEAEETGEDLERRKHWEWTIEDNDRWDEKLRIKKERSEFEFDGAFGRDHSPRSRRPLGLTHRFQLGPQRH